MFRVRLFSYFALFLIDEAPVPKYLYVLRYIHSLSVYWLEFDVEDSLHLAVADEVAERESAEIEV